MEAGNVPGNIFNQPFGPFSIFGYVILNSVQRGIAWTLHQFATGQTQPIGSLVLLATGNEEIIIYVPEVDENVKTFLRLEYSAYQEWDIIVKDVPVELKGTYLRLVYTGKGILKGLPAAKRRRPNFMPY